MENLELMEKKKELQREIESFIRIYRRLRNINFYINAAMVFGSLSLAAGVTYMSLNEASWNATVFGIALTFLIGLHNAFSFGEKAEFYRIITTESENLLSALKFGDTDFNEVLRKFIALRESAAKSVPRGRGMGILKDLYKG